MAFLATLFAFLVLLGTILDLVVGAAAAIAQLTLLAICDCMPCLATIEAALLTYRAILVTLLPFCAAANVPDVALLAAFLAGIILFRAIVTSVVSAAAALAFFRSCAFRRWVTCLTAVEAFFLANRTLLLLAGRLVA